MSKLGLSMCARKYFIVQYIWLYLLNCQRCVLDNHSEQSRLLFDLLVPSHLTLSVCEPIVTNMTINYCGAILSNKHSATSTYSIATAYNY